MEIIGTRLSGTREGGYAAMEQKDAKAVEAITREQVALGADFVVLDATMMDDEKETLVWTAQHVLASCPGTGLFLHVSDAETAVYLFENVKPMRSIIDGVSLVYEGFDLMMDCVCRNHASVVARPVHGEQKGSTSGQQFEASEEMVRRITEQDVSLDHIYMDLLAEDLSSEPKSVSRAAQTACTLRARFPAMHLLSRMDGIAGALPRPQIVAAAALGCLMTMTADSIMLDPTHEDLVFTARALGGVLGYDSKFKAYIRACENA